jgi:nitrite transporter NirC
VPVPIPEALAAHGDAAVTKTAQVRTQPLRYLLLSALAGAFVGIAVVLLLSVGGPFAAAASPFAKLIMGAVFGVALTLVVFAGAELFTGNVMVMLQGLMARRVSGRDLALVWVGSLVGNIVGSIGFAALVHGGGTLDGGPGAALVASLTAAKDAASGPQLLWRSVLCNLLVCLGLWMAARTKSDVAKLVVLWWALLAFIASGFEHSIANATLFSIGVFEGSADWSMLVRNLAWTVPGNVLGGGLLVGLAYGWVGRPVTTPPTPTVVASPAAAPTTPAVAERESVPA